MKLSLLKPYVWLVLMSALCTTAMAQMPTYRTPGGSSSNNFPFNTTTSNKVQWVYAPSEFNTPPPAGLITHVYFLTDNYQGQSGVSFQGYRISIKEVNYTTFSSGTYETNLKLCYGPTNTTISIPSTGWFGVELDTPFVYNGTSNLVIEATITNTNGLRVDQNTAGGNKRIWGGRNNTSGSTGSGQAGVGLEIITCSTAVTKQPQPKQVCENQQAQFSINAIDVNSYQWQVDEGTGFNDIANNTNYSGATTSTLTVNGTPFSFDGYNYRCMIYNGSCSDSSQSAQLNVNGLVKLDKLPPNDTTCVNAFKELEVKGNGSIVKYRWQRYNSITQMYEDVPVTPPYVHLGNKLQILGVPDTLDGAEYRVVVTGVCDSSVSTSSLLTVTQVPKVAVPPADKNAKPGDDVTFQVQSTAPGSRFQWQVAAPDTFVNINEGGIYQGVKTNRLRVFGVSRVQDKFKFRCVVKTGTACIAPGDTSQFAVLYVEPAASVNAINADQQIALYPNPANGAELNIEMKGFTSVGMKYQVIDKTGRMLKQSDITGAATRVDIGMLSADIYFVRFLDADKEVVATTKFVKL